MCRVYFARPRLQGMSVLWLFSAQVRFVVADCRLGRRPKRPKTQQQQQQQKPPATSKAPQLNAFPAELALPADFDIKQLDCLDTSNLTEVGHFLHL